MPRFLTGDLLKAKGLIIVTACSFLTSRVRLVMGFGASRVLKLKEPGIDHEFGGMIDRSCGHLGRYGLMFHGRYGLFQTRCRFNEKVNTGLIRMSMSMLGQMAKRNPGLVFNLEFPGTEYGGATDRQLVGLMSHAPSNVNIWQQDGGPPYGLHPGAHAEIIGNTETARLGFECSHDPCNPDGLRAHGGNR